MTSVMYPALNKAVHDFLLTGGRDTNTLVADLKFLKIYASFRDCKKASMSDDQGEGSKKVQHVCEVCDKKFGYWSDMNRHRRTHTGIIPTPECPSLN